MSQQSAFRRSQRRTALAFAAVYGAITVAIVACSPGEAAAPAAAVIDDAGAPATLVLAERRLCAAVVVYGAVRSDAYDQAAVAARTALNGFNELGHTPDCGLALTRTVAAGVDPDRWQRALDAVDAIEDGSYVVPLACSRAAVILPSRAAVRAQCVFGDLAFVESGR
ncbi:hypothetical protein [Luteimonas sp. FCS-9]|uniref:hypothetical protein n=1 Tax=Luteimonas sp. FCS-9 TaxID=1547516 RepID=UPI00063EABE2|nr:hypothetical protein [Luteimonas sp. FCS-9]KLJ02850.1 hypothetical protein WQ56_00790 [Luteimonas sp. FCS-9]